MGVRCQDTAAAVDRRAVRHKQRTFAVDDRARILHRAIGKVRHRDDVEFCVRIGIVEIGFLLVDHLVGDIHRHVQLVALACRGKAAERHLLGADRIGWQRRAFAHVIRANGQRDEIGLDLTGRRK